MLYIVLHREQHTSLFDLPWANYSYFFIIVVVVLVWFFETGFLCVALAVLLLHPKGWD